MAPAKARSPCVTRSELRSVRRSSHGRAGNNHALGRRHAEARPSVSTCVAQRRRGAGRTGDARREEEARRSGDEGLLAMGRAAGRGDEGKDRDARAVAEVVGAIMAADGAAAADGRDPGVDGTWRLVFCSTPLVFRATPFYWLVGETAKAVTGDPALVNDTVFPALGGLQEPLRARFGDIEQTIQGTRLVSRVGLSVLDGALSVTLVTTARIISSDDPSIARVVVESSRVCDTPVPLLDTVDVPVEAFFDGLAAALTATAGRAPATPTITTRFVGERVRATEVDGVVMMFERV